MNRQTLNKLPMYNKVELYYLTNKQMKNFTETLERGIAQLSLLCVYVQNVKCVITFIYCFESCYTQQFSVFTFFKECSLLNIRLVSAGVDGGRVECRDAQTPIMASGIINSDWFILE